MATDQEYLDLIHKKIAKLGQKRAKELYVGYMDYHKRSQGENPPNLKSLVPFLMTTLGGILASLEVSQDEDMAKQLANEAMKELGEV